MTLKTMLKLSTLALTPMIALAGFAQPALADTTVLDFSGNICGPAGNQPCGDGSGIGQNYGDSALVDVSYRAVNPGTEDEVLGNLFFWTNNYGDLQNVVYGGGTSEIRLTPSAGNELSLTSFLSGCYLDRASCLSFPFSITSVSGTPILAGAVANPVGGHDTIAVNSGYFSDGIVLRWGPDSFNGGLDNITFDVRAIGGGMGAVPEPATWGMMITGFGLVGGAMRRRRRTTLSFA